MFQSCNIYLNRYLNHSLLPPHLCHVGGRIEKLDILKHVLPFQKYIVFLGWG